MTSLTIRDIARKCGVSISTVSRAINNDPGINPQTRERVLQVVKECNYIPNNSARNLKMQESNTVALLVKGLNNPFFQGMFDDFERGLEKEGYQYLLHTVPEHADEEYTAEEIAKEKRLKGIIFLGGKMDHPETLREKIGIPFVLCSVAGETEMHETAKVSSVSIDDEKESYEVIRYLTAKGHRRIAILAGRAFDRTVGFRRLTGYRRALEEAGIAFDEGLVFYQREDLPEYSEANGYSVMREALESGRDFTAIFVISDRLSVGVYKAIHEAGKKIPEDYSVVGFDGIELTRYLHPSLTTVIQPARDMIRASIELLMEQIQGREGKRGLIYPARLQERESVRDLTEAGGREERV